MRKTKPLSIRLPETLIAQLEYFSKSQNMTLKAFFLDAVNEKLKKMVGNKKFKKVVQEMKQKIDKQIQRGASKDDSRDLYTVINYLKRIVKHSKDNYSLTGDVNMDIVNFWLKKCKREYELLDADVQKTLKKQYDFLMTFKSRNVVEKYAITNHTKNIWGSINDKAIESKKNNLL